MKHRRTLIVVLLNILFCAIVLYFFANYSQLRPYAGSAIKEVLAGLLLLTSIYANYFLLYPLLRKKHPVVYWVVVVFVSIVAGLIEMIIAWPFIKICCAATMDILGSSRLFLHHLMIVTARDLAFNFFPYMFRERQELRKALDAEVQVVYRDTQMVDVVDHESNLLMIPKDDIYYCVQDGNFTRIYTVHDSWFTRLGSMKHLVQLFGEEEFVRISPTVLIPYQYIWSCNGSEVFLKKMPWTKKPLSFTLDSKNSDPIADKIAEGLQRYKAQTGGEQVPKRKPRSNYKRKPVVPPQQKLDMVHSCIQANPGCNTTDIVAQTEISLSTVERCLSELRKRKLVKYVGSKRHGGYHVNS
ncbi:MAG: winged helix-turn-helix transcriptional regulator [Bacteroidales bacterium]|nr:winged helix-turn-helix transcriptional regulator [Bacteroidales bacterium]